MGLEPDLYPLLASTPGPGLAGPTSAGYQDPALDTLLEAARKPGTRRGPDRRVEGAAGRARARLPMLPLAWHDEVRAPRGGRRPTPRLIAGPGDRFWDVLAWRLAADR